MTAPYDGMVLDNPRSPRIRAAAKLAKRTARLESGLFLVEGPLALAEALAYRPEDVIEVFVTPTALEREQAVAAALDAADVDVEFVTEPVLETIATTVTPQGVVAVCRQFPTSVRRILEGTPRLVAILEEVRDPGNAGTIIRAADAAGADAVIMTGRAVDPFNPKVVRSTTGSLFHLPFAVGADLVDVRTRVRAAGLRLLAADVSGEELTVIRDGGELAAPSAWIFGNEARGLPEEYLALADRVVRVPIYGKAESMNLATAASVCLYASAFAQRA